MIRNIGHVFRYFWYFLTARGRHGLHSPFVYKLYEQVILFKGAYYAYANIESVRSSLLISKESISVTDFGAGSAMGFSKKRKVGDITRLSAKSPKYSQLLFRLVKESQAEHLLEIGTSLGISSLYLAAPNPKSKVITLEGCPETSSIAQRNFDQLKAENIRLITGDFKETLDPALKELKRLDFVFFDGNHRKEPTLEYFNKCLELAHPNTVFVIDDIYWSPEMKAAWKEICAHPKVRTCIDLFFVGIIYFREDSPKQYFKLRF